MKRETLLLAVVVTLLMTCANLARADALLRAWAESGNEFPIRLWVQRIRGGFPSGTTRTVLFSIQNPQPRQTFVLQAVATYTTAKGEVETSYSNPVTIEVDRAARDCLVYFYVINGFIEGGSLSISGLDLSLPYDSSFVVIPINELPASIVLRGEFRLFAR